MFLFLLQTEVPTSNLRRIINSRNTISEENCGARGPTGTSVSFMECNAEGFIGAYDPPPLHLHNLLLENDKGDYSSNVSLNLFRRRRLLADSPISNVSGIYNPTICVQNEELMLFHVSQEHYPVYDS